MKLFSANLLLQRMSLDQSILRPLDRNHLQFTDNQSRHTVSFIIVRTHSPIIISLSFINSVSQSVSQSVIYSLILSLIK